jgi:hypothetical protein
MKPNLFIASPVYGAVTVEFMQSLMRLQAEPPCNLSVRILAGDSLVSRARNTITAEFLKSDCTHLLFIDSDLVFSADQIMRLVEHDKDVVGGYYPKKQEGSVEWVCNCTLPFQPAGADGLQPLRYLGTGFLMVKRAVFEQMIAALGDKIAYRPDPRPTETEWDFWAVGPHTDAAGHTRYLSEDWFFCQRWLDLGGQVWGDTRVILRHIGTASYPLKTQLADLVNPDFKEG